MKTEVIVITGTSGARKSSIARSLCKKHEILQLVPAVTSRSRRQDDTQGEYEYISKDQFNKLNAQDKLLIKSEYRAEFYGITREAFQQICAKGKTPVLILTPESVRNFKLIDSFLIFTVFLDTEDIDLNERLKRRGATINAAVVNQRADDRKCLMILKELLTYLYVINNMDVDKTTELIWSLWEYRKSGGMLPKRLIQLMLECGMLLKEAKLENVSGASYDLTLDADYYHKGKVKTLDDNDPFIKLEPGDYAFVGSKEIANFPKDIAGKFGLSVGLFFRGIILSNGPQVDPGFHGRLFCLLFNTSNREIQLKLGQHYATIEFVKLIEPTDYYAGEYQEKNKITDYLSISVKRSAISELREEVRELKKKLTGQTLPIVLSAIAIVVAVAILIIQLTLTKKP